MARSRILTNQSEIEHNNMLKSKILKQSKKLGYSCFNGKLHYTLLDKNKIINFFKNKRGYKDICEISFRFWEGDKETDGMQYKTNETDFWHWTTTTDFYNKINNYPSLEFEVVSITSPDQPKIKKPVELRGVKQYASILTTRSTIRCQVFLKDSDVWIKHNDYFSPHYFNKDNRMVVVTTRAWIKITNLLNQDKEIHPLHIANEIISLQEDYERLPNNKLCNTEMSRLWEDVVKAVHVKS